MRQTSLYTDIRTRILQFGIAGGLYPALVLSGFRPGETLMSDRSLAGAGSGRLRNLLVIPFCVLAGAIALLIVWLTVAGNTLRVANTKPVYALRYE